MSIQEIKKILEDKIKNKQSYIHNIDESIRGTGKTHMLTELSQYYKIPIITPDIFSSRHIQLIASVNNFANVLPIIRDINLLHGRNFSIVLVDEGVGNKFIDELKNLGLTVIGISNIYYENPKDLEQEEESDWRVCYQKWVDGGRK